MPELKFYSEYVTPVVDSGMRGLCTKPYHAHPKGCPNYGQRDTCPPAAPYFKDYFDRDFDIWALHTSYDLAAHRDRMLEKHPHWSERQLVNCRHWQGTVRAFLRRKATVWVEKQRMIAVPFSNTTCHTQQWEYTTCPEAMGVNLSATMESAGVILEWPPKNITRMIYLAGVKKNG